MSQTGCFVDSNLLVLLIVGSAGKYLIAKHRRLRQFSAADYDTLADMISKVDRVFVTPNTLTEASNLLAQHRDPERLRFFDKLRFVIEESKEVVVASNQARVGTWEMSDKSAIEWTDATWNPVTGCTKVTRGCDNCYAERIAERFRGTPGHPFEQGFDLTLRPERLSQPLSWKRSRRVFVNSMSDLFHKDIPADFIDSVFDTMEAADWHIFQVLTKRSSLMRSYLQNRYGARAARRHIWCGVSVEDHIATARIRHLREAPVPIRFLSIEPLLGPVGNIDLEGISWVIVGGESGPKGRPMELQWVREIKDLCAEEGVDFFFKQWGGRKAKSGGRQLDGVEHNAMPVHITEESERALQLAS